MSAQAYPLAWPPGWKRAAHRRNGKFRDGAQWISVAKAVARVISELRRLGVESHTIIISSNIETRVDGLPRSDRRVDIADPGVAVYWTDPDSGQQRCMAIDLYTWVSDNIAAIAATIAAMRAIERHGGATILNRAFQGFQALPSATTTALNAKTAADVLHRRTGRAAAMILADREVARAAYREAANVAHPDRGGTTSDFQLIHEAKRVLEAHFGGAL